DQLEDASAAGDERLVVDQAALDVGVPAHRVEVVLLVVVERRLFPEAAEHRVGIGVDGDVVRVVVDVVRRFAADGHAPPSSRRTPPMPCTTPPAIWPSTTLGLIIGPQSSPTM